MTPPISPYLLRPKRSEEEVRQKAAKPGLTINTFKAIQDAIAERTRDEDRGEQYDGEAWPT